MTSYDIYLMKVRGDVNSVTQRDEKKHRHMEMYLSQIILSVCDRIISLYTYIHFCLVLTTAEDLRE